MQRHRRDAEATWRSRKERYIAHVAGASISVRLVSACDKLHNARAILSDLRAIGEPLWGRFNAEAGKSGVLWYYRALVDAFRNAPMTGGLRRVVEELDRTMERVGVPIYQDRRGREARWRVMEGYRRRLSSTLSWPEMLALAAARKVVEGLSAAATALTKINDGLAAGDRAANGALRRGALRAAGRRSDYAPKSDALRTLVDAIERQESVRFKYRKAGDCTGAERVVDPYLLHVQSGALYVIGFCHVRNTVRTFLLDASRKRRAPERSSARARRS